MAHRVVFLDVELEVHLALGRVGDSQLSAGGEATIIVSPSTHALLILARVSTLAYMGAE